MIKTIEKIVVKTIQILKKYSKDAAMAAGRAVDHKKRVPRIEKNGKKCKEAHKKKHRDESKIILGCYRCKSASAPGSIWKDLCCVCKRVKNEEKREKNTTKFVLSKNKNPKNAKHMHPNGYVARLCKKQNREKKERERNREKHTKQCRHVT